MSVSQTASAAVIAIFLFGPAFYMARDRDPCEGFIVSPVRDKVVAGDQLVMTFTYPKTCPMTVLTVSMRWRVVDGKGHMLNFDNNPDKLLRDGNDGNPVGVTMTLPDDAAPGKSVFRLTLDVDKNILQSTLGWHVQMTPPDVPFEIIPPENQKETPNG